MEATVTNLDFILPSSGSHGKILGRVVTLSDLHDPILKACFVCHAENRLEEGNNENRKSK